MYPSGTRKRPDVRRHLRMAGGGLVAALALAVIPDRKAEMVRAPLVLAMAPAQRGLAKVRRVGEGTVVRLFTQMARADRLARAEVEGQRLAEENGRLKSELQIALDQVRLLSRRDVNESSLLSSRCLPTRILGIQAQSYLARHHLIDVGRSHGVGPEALVIRPATIVVEGGVDQGFESGDVVVAGCCVWGKIVSAGYHASVVCPMTEPGFRDLVRLAAPAADGQALRFGAKGILEGTGEPLARLRMIDTTEPVVEGDLVYSLGGQGFVDTPLFCGRVARVERPSGAGHWDIWVQPAVGEPPDDLAILCPQAGSVDVAGRAALSGTESRVE